MRHALIALGTTLVLTGCEAQLGGGETLCRSNEYRVVELGEDQQLGSGRCVKRGAGVPDGTVRYPPDLEPGTTGQEEDANRRFQERLDAERGSPAPI